MSSSRGRGAWLLTLSATAAASAALHVGGLALAARLEPLRPPRSAPVEVEFEAVSPPEPARAEPPEPPPPFPPKTPRHIAVAKLPSPPNTPRPQRPQPPSEPPPGEPPPSGAPAAREVPRVGISISSTTSAGGFAVGVGNTLFGRAPEVAADPREVKPYAAEGDARAPGTPRLSAQPRLLEQPDVPYPAEARHAGVEGQVKLLLRIDRQGRVASARVLTDPGAGLGEAARSAALRFRFSPGVLDGDPVEVPDFVFTYTFVLE